MLLNIFSVFSFLAVFFSSAAAFAVEAKNAIDMTAHWTGYAALGVFVLAYMLVIFEEGLHLRKSKPVMVAAGIIWVLVAIAYSKLGRQETVADILRHSFLEYAEMAFFLLSAMTFINTMSERNIFEALRAKLVSMGLSLRSLFWVTGVAAFFLSPIADNLTTALVMGAVALAVGGARTKFVAVSCINIVVAANAGGAFSPFGDITTLMVWQKGLVTFTEFFALFTPSLISWLVPAFFMSLAIPADKPEVSGTEVQVKYGGYVTTVIFLLTIAVTVLLHQFFHLPPFVGMMSGLGFLSVFAHFIRRHELKEWRPAFPETDDMKPATRPFDVFISMKRVEWDTLMFFYGVMLCVGGLGALGYLGVASDFLYHDLGVTTANVLVGILSALIDNIPVMFAVLTMQPDMSHGQWLLVTLTAGIGGSLLSIGSAAGVALMGQARGVYTFFSHLKWTWAVALGYAAGIWAHLIINKALF